jgi:hypothetical protein
MLIPLFPANGHQALLPHERLADLFIHEFHKFDILCLQEVWGLPTGECKEATIAYA